MLAVFLLMILFGALLVVAFSVGLVWLLLNEGGEDGGRAGQPLSLTESFARELNSIQVWRALSAWMTAKPLRIENRRDSDRT